MTHDVVSTPTIEQRVDPSSADPDTLKAQLRQAQKLASLGTMAAMIAHEYNNIFTPMVSYAQLALDKNDVALMRKALTLVLQQHDAVQSMSDRVLGLVRGESYKMEKVNLRDVVAGAIACLGRDLSKDSISVVIDIDDRLIVHGNHNQLQQVLFNLVLNARQAMLDRQGRMRITATPISDGLVSVHVRDNSQGIDEQHLDRLFDPFFTTKRDKGSQDKRGIGLGLAVCKDILQKHGGEITVESIKDHGTTFTITLPMLT